MNDIKKLMGARILSEANDLKRTIGALAQEIEFDETQLKSVVSGDCDIQDTFEVIARMGKCYPIDQSDLYFIENDCTNGVRFMTAEESKDSARIFDRKDKDGNRTPYYDYRDTAMSKLSPFKPEWIKELRVVDNDDPENPDVAYNNGHFLHQMTFFIGPVNFYWEVDGKKYCKEMNTGDSNYITPFWPHSFASRDASQPAIIMAITYGGDVRRAQKEFYSLGLDKIKNFKLDFEVPNKATADLIRQHMKNENITAEVLQQRIDKKNTTINLQSALDNNDELSIDQLQVLAELLNIELGDLLLSKNANEQKVIVEKKSEDNAYYFPNDNRQSYKMYPLARCSKMPHMKGFDIEVLAKENDVENPFETSLHSYVYNYGKSALTFKWESDGKHYEKIFAPGDSMYVQPFVKHSYANDSDTNGKLCVCRVSGAVNLPTQKELSYFADINRVIESKCWFD